MSGTSNGVLNEPVLVLNKGYQAIHVVQARKAISLLYQGVAEAINDDFASYPFNMWCEISKEEIEEGNGQYNYLHSPRIKVRIPHVIRLITYDSLPARDVMFNRKNIYARDKCTCQYCGKRFRGEELTFDHIIPKSKGGKNSWENVVTCCISCNHSKGNKSLSEAGMSLIKSPNKPRWRSYVKIPFSRLKEVKLKLWQEFLKKPYWKLDN